ncbi:lysine--tRNA ligase [Candidatus Woesearchaeota archaeon]|jgi:lysyl-tRNA synthetase, class I|nr:lysine--tRNA ligase [Candidatus Woesearchaeota archaeon]MBT6023343.1 lysine--tRNA ligase [Candidatus Woesearchaeota archaeon]
MKSQYWADQIAERLIKSRKKKSFTVASGITPSGTIHFGNFREIITTEIISRALKDAGAKVRFIYSWDDYDRFRKVPKNMPKQSILKKYIGFPVSQVPNVFGTKHKSYADYLESELEKSVKLVGVKPEFIQQQNKYPKRHYAEEIRTAFQNRGKIARILNKYRKEPLADDWYPGEVFCKKHGNDFTKIIDYDGEYKVTYEHKSGFIKTLDFRKETGLKLKWKADWPMRWAHERVDFEPGGKDHSTYGSSYTVGKDIVKIFDWIAPEYVMYDFINMKGGQGKMSSSAGNAQSLRDVLRFYIPELARYTFAGRTPKTEIFYPMDEGIFKHYEDFYYTERVAFGKEEVSKKEQIQQERVYRMSVVDKVPGTMPIQPSFKHCVELMNIYQGNINQALKNINLKRKIDKNRYSQVLTCAWNWINEFATERYIFKINEKTPRIKMTINQKSAIKDLTKILSKNLNEKQLFKEFGRITKENELGAKDFFQPIYKILINKPAGPRLAPFILAIGRTKVRKLLTI